jgi:hypothetical protein
MDARRLGTAMRRALHRYVLIAAPILDAERLSYVRGQA